MESSKSISMLDCLIPQFPSIPVAPEMNRDNDPTTIQTTLTAYWDEQQQNFAHAVRMTSTLGAALQWGAAKDSEQEVNLLTSYASALQHQNRLVTLQRQFQEVESFLQSMITSNEKVESSTGRAVYDKAQATLKAARDGLREVQIRRYLLTAFQQAFSDRLTSLEKFRPQVTELPTAKAGNLVKHTNIITINSLQEAPAVTDQPQETSAALVETFWLNHQRELVADLIKASCATIADAKSSTFYARVAYDLTQQPLPERVLEGLKNDANNLMKLSRSVEGEQVTLAKIVGRIKDITDSLSTTMKEQQQLLDSPLCRSDSRPSIEAIIATAKSSHEKMSVICREATTAETVLKSRVDSAHKEIQRLCTVINNNGQELGYLQSFQLYNSGSTTPFQDFALKQTPPESKVAEPAQPTTSSEPLPPSATTTTNDPLASSVADDASKSSTTSDSGFASAVEATSTLASSQEPPVEVPADPADSDDLSQTTADSDDLNQTTIGVSMTTTTSANDTAITIPGDGVSNTDGDVPLTQHPNTPAPAPTPAGDSEQYVDAETDDSMSQGTMGRLANALIAAFSD